MEKEKAPAFLSFEMQEDEVNDISANMVMSPTNNSNSHINEESAFLPFEMQENTLEIVKDTLETINNENTNKEQQEVIALEKNSQELMEEVNVENEGVFEDELEELHKSKLRECDTETLKHLLHVETEMLARSKAKEEVVINTIKCQRQELKESQIHLDKEIAYLTDMTERLKYQLEQEHLNRKQLEQEMSNTGKIVQMLTENYCTLKESHDTTSEGIENLEQEQNVQFNSYNWKKSELLDSTEKENRELVEIQNNWEKEISEYNAELDKVTDNINELTKKEADIVKEIAHKTEINAKVESKLQEDKKVLAELRNEEQMLLDEIHIVNQKNEEFQKLQTEKAVEFKDILLAKENELTHSIEELKNAEEQKARTIKELEDEVENTNKLEGILLGLEEQHVSLLTKKEEMKKRAKVVNENQKAHINSLECEIQKLDDDMVKTDREITNIVTTKLEKLEELHLKKQIYEQGMQKLSDLENVCEEFNKKIDVMMCAHTENEQKFNSIRNQLTDLKEILSNEQNKHDSLKNKRDEQVQKLNQVLNQKQTEFDKIQEEATNSIKDLQNELTAYKDKTEKLFKENRGKNKKVLEKLQNNLKKVTDELNKEENNLKELKSLIEQRKAESSKLEISLELTKFDVEEPVLRQESTNVKPTGILKSPGKRTPPKNVSWRVPSTSTIDSEPLADISQNKQLNVSPYFNDTLDNIKSKDDLFDELMMMSPSDEVEEVAPKKRSRK